MLYFQLFCGAGNGLRQGKMNVNYAPQTSFILCWLVDVKLKCRLCFFCFFVCLHVNVKYECEEELQTNSAMSAC